MPVPSFFSPKPKVDTGGGGMTTVVLKVAVQFFAALIVTVVVAFIPLQSPLQLPNVYPEFGIAVRETVLPLGKLPPPETLPLPIGVAFVLRVYVVGVTLAAKFAVQVLFAVPIATVVVTVDVEGKLALEQSPERLFN